MGPYVSIKKPFDFSGFAPWVGEFPEQVVTWNIKLMIFAFFLVLTQVRHGDRFYQSLRLVTLLSVW